MFTALFCLFFARYKLHVSDKVVLDRPVHKARIGPSQFYPTSIKCIYYFFLFSKRRKLSTYEIALFLQQDEEENFDDSDKDPDFMEMDARSDSSDSSDDQDMVIRANKRPASVPETRVYMDPPVERGDADTDKDSGKYSCFYSLFFYIHCTIYTPLSSIFTPPPLLYSMLTPRPCILYKYNSIKFLTILRIREFFL